MRLKKEKISDIETVIIYEPFYFWITKEKKLIIIKINPAKEENIRSILDKHQNITIIKTDKPFNVYIRFLRAGKEVVQTNHIVEDTEFYHSVREVVSVFR